MKAEVIRRIITTGVMAIVRAESIARGKEIAEGCLAGGVDVMEISYTLPNASEVISELKRTYGERLLIGAGTVLEEVTARLAILAGAQFIIAPTFSKKAAKLCNLYQIPYAPGCTSYSEMCDALMYGATFIKAFPIANFYGPKLISVCKTPLPQLSILASGGITLENLSEWIKNGADCVGIGSLLTKGSSDEIAENAKRITEIIREAREA